VSTFPDRPNTALLVIDVQTGVVARGHARDAVVANIAAAVSRARDAGTPVIWVQHTEAPHLLRDSDAWEIVAELTPAPGEARIEKGYGDAFEQTDLTATLARLGVGRLIVTGAQTDQCIRGTLHGGLVRGYDVTLVSDAHTTEDNTEWGAPPPGAVIAHTNLYWTHETAPGRTAGTVTTADLDFAAGS
jgi:nicotinamidase-related amidase